MRILIVGNILKDVYLSLDERRNKFETDENNVRWMDVAFSGETYPYFSRTSVFSGATITLEIFKKLGISAAFSGSENTKIADSYRYILSSGDNIAYFSESKRKPSKFIAPNQPVDWIFVDRSAEINYELVEKIKNYLGLTRAKLAIFANTKKMEDTIFHDSAKELIRVASVVFADGELEDIAPRGVICRISDREIRCGSFVRRYKVSDNASKTHLTTYSIVAATIFGAMLNGCSTIEALEMAALNAENSTLTETLTLERLKKMILKRKETDGNLRLIAKTLLSPGRGILAADESGGSIHKKFEEAGITDDASHRRDYRNIFFTTHNLEKYVSGVILFDETARQKADNGENFVNFLTDKGIVAGIKVDEGLEPFSEPEYANEKWTKGLDTLPKRLAEYYEMGARFAKWRAAFEVTLDGVGGENISVKTPSSFAILKNCEILAQYARDCQNAGIVPIVEPEVVHDGYYSIETCAQITGDILDCLFSQLEKFNVNLEGCIVKTNMVLAGKRYETKSTPDEVGKWTVKVLKEHCPKELAGVVFLSGGQSVEQATQNLQAITNYSTLPFPVTFSYARALQSPALDAWRGDNNNADEARRAFAARLVANCRALIKNKLN